MTAFPNSGHKDLKMDLSGYKTGFLHKATYAFALNFKNVFQGLEGGAWTWPGTPGPDDLGFLAL